MVKFSPNTTLTLDSHKIKCLKRILSVRTAQVFPHLTKPMQDGIWKTWRWRYHQRRATLLLFLYRKRLVKETYCLGSMLTSDWKYVACHEWSLDLKSGYYYIAIGEKDKHNTAFWCSLGFYEFNHMSGSTNATTNIQSDRRKMQDLSKPTLDTKIIKTYSNLSPILSVDAWR